MYLYRFWRLCTQSYNYWPRHCWTIWPHTRKYTHTCTYIMHTCTYVYTVYINLHTYSMYICTYMYTLYIMYTLRTYICMYIHGNSTYTQQTDTAMHTPTHIYICMYIHTRINTFTCILLFMHGFWCVYAHAQSWQQKYCVSENWHRRAHTHTNIHMLRMFYVHIYTHMYICIYVHAFWCVYTHAQN